MKEHDLDSLLAAIDGPADAPDDAEERVWQTLRADLFADSPASSPSPEDDNAAVLEVVSRPPTPIDLADSQRIRRRTFGVLVAAAALLLAGLAVVLLPDDSDDLRVTDDSVPVEPAPVDRPEACLGFRLDSPLFDELEDAITNDVAMAPELVGMTQLGLDQLESDLDDVGALTTTLRNETFPTLGGTLNQARLSILDGDVDAARQAIDFAQQTYEESDLASDSCLG